MPCFDKKLEASRNDFMNEEVRDVDCVLTPGEVLEIIKEKEIDFVGLPESSVDKQYSPYALSRFLLWVLFLTMLPFPP